MVLKKFEELKIGDTSDFLRCIKMHMIKYKQLYTEIESI